MRSALRSFSALSLFPVLSATLCLAQRSPADKATGCACCGVFIFVPVLLLAFNIALLVWVARDAKARGMDSAVLWVLLIFFFSFVGLIIYLLSRPQGYLVPCQNCGNRKLQASLKCPHCGFGV